MESFGQNRDHMRYQNTTHCPLPHLYLFSFTVCLYVELSNFCLVVTQEGIKFCLNLSEDGVQNFQLNTSFLKTGWKPADSIIYTLLLLLYFKDSWKTLSGKLLIYRFLVELYEMINWEHIIIVMSLNHSNFLQKHLLLMSSSSEQFPQMDWSCISPCVKQLSVAWVISLSVFSLSHFSKKKKKSIIIKCYIFFCFHFYRFPFSQMLL